MRMWPVVLVHGPVALRPLSRRDRAAWGRLRVANARWLDAWEATSPDPRQPAPSFSAYVGQVRQEARRGSTLPFVVEHHGEMVGQLTVSGIALGSLCSGSIGYWVAEAVAGRGIAPTAVALATDHCWAAGLHRLEVNVRPENGSSLRVVEKLGFRDEGIRRRYLHVDGDWRDHRSFALTREEVPGGLLERWLARGGGPR